MQKSRKKCVKKEKIADYPEEEEDDL